jgi:hypothetical protein
MIRYANHPTKSKDLVFVRLTTGRAYYFETAANNSECINP